MDKNIHCGLKMVLLLLAFTVVQMATVFAESAAPDDQWYWLSSDDNYSKFFDPESVVVTRTVEATQGKVPTEIQVWTKTAYSYGGAKETLNA